MENKSVALVIGSDSLIGGSLIQAFKDDGEPIIGTTRRKDTVNDQNIYLDLSSKLTEWPFDSFISIAIICAGITRLEHCRSDPEATSRVNIEGITSVVGELVRRGAFVVYLSTSGVFDGSVPFRPAGDCFSPVTEHGRQKAEAERILSQWAESMAIVRMGKVLSANYSLFSQWTLDVKKGLPIHPFKDLPVSPIPLPWVVSTLRTICEKELRGITQLSGSRDVTYAEAAHIGLNALDINHDLIQPISAHDSGTFNEVLPKYTTLNIDRLKDCLGLDPPSVEAAIRYGFGITD